MKKPRYRTIVSFVEFQIPTGVGNLKSIIIELCKILSSEFKQYKAYKFI